MEYNSQRTHLNIPEYGRNIQKMIDYACQTENREERNKMAKAIIRIMSTISPQSKDLSDSEQRLWNHLFQISNYTLDIDCPFPIPTQQINTKKPERIQYPSKAIKYKHYGHTVENLIKAAILMSDGEEKNALIERIANLMKKFYLNWNRDSVNDKLIMDHLQELSQGKLQVRDDFSLEHTQDILARNISKKKKKMNGKFSHPSNKFRKK